MTHARPAEQPRPHFRCRASPGHGLGRWCTLRPSTALAIPPAAPTSTAPPMAPNTIFNARSVPSCCLRHIETPHHPPPIATPRKQAIIATHHTQPIMVATPDTHSGPSHPPRGCAHAVSSGPATSAPTSPAATPTHQPRNLRSCPVAAAATTPEATTTPQAASPRRSPTRRSTSIVWFRARPRRAGRRRSQSPQSRQNPPTGPPRQQAPARPRTQKALQAQTLDRLRPDRPARRVIAAVLAFAGAVVALVLIPFLTAPQRTYSTSYSSLVPVTSAGPHIFALYQAAAAARCPSAELHWAVLAGVAAVESAHGSLGGRTVDPNDYSIAPTPIFGPLLDGSLAGTRVVPIGPYAGRYGLRTDAQYQRALGPMQFLPGTWESTVSAHSLPGRDPHNYSDAVHASAAKLCEAARRHAAAAQSPSAAVRSALSNTTTPTPTSPQCSPTPPCTPLTSPSRRRPVARHRAPTGLRALHTTRPAVPAAVSARSRRRIAAAARRGRPRPPRDRRGALDARASYHRPRRPAHPSRRPRRRSARRGALQHRLARLHRRLHVRPHHAPAAPAALTHASEPPLQRGPGMPRRGARSVRPAPLRASALKR